jgi:hypothetical protein
MEKRFIQSSLIKRRRSQVFERQQPELIVHKLEVAGSVAAFVCIRQPANNLPRVRIQHFAAQGAAATL